MTQHIHAYHNLLSNIEHIAISFVKEHAEQSNGKEHATGIEEAWNKLGHDGKRGMFAADNPGPSWMSQGSRGKNHQRASEA